MKKSNPDYDAHKAFLEYLYDQEGLSSMNIERLEGVIERHLQPFLEKEMDLRLKSLYSASKDQIIEGWKGFKENKDLECLSHGFTVRQILFLYIKYYALMNNLNPEDLLNPMPIVEGDPVLATSLRYERNSALKELCLQERECRCEACGFDFMTKYGDIGKGYIEMHHLRPLSTYDSAHEITTADVVLLCANCHRMIHKKKPDGQRHPFELWELKEILERQRNAHEN